MKSYNHYLKGDRLIIILDNLMEGFQIIGKDWRYLYVNKAAARQGKTTKEHLIGRTMMEVYPGIENTELFSAMKQCMESRVAHQMENQFIFPNGSKGWFELNIEPIPEGISILSIDITELKRAEAHIMNLNRLYATLSQVNRAMLHVKDINDYFKSICRIAVDTGKFELAWIGTFDHETGEMTPVAVYGMGSDPFPFETINLNDTPFNNGIMAKAVKSGKVTYSRDIQTDPSMAHKREMAIRKGYHSAATIPFRINSEICGFLNLYSKEVDFFADEDQQKLLEEIGMDISITIETLKVEAQRKRAEEALRKSEEQLRLISENVADMIAVLDLEGKWLYANASHKPLLGDPESLRGTDFFQAIHPDDRERIRQIFQETARTGIGQLAEYRFVLKDGSVRCIEGQGSVIRDEKGNVAQIVVVSRDVTEKKLVEKQLLRAQRMESIGTLAGGIAHDLNNVFSPIMLSFDILKKKLPDKPSQKMLSMLESIAKRGSDLIKQVLSFARGVEGERTIVQIKHIVDEVGKIINETFPKSITLRSDVPKNLPTVLADPTQIHQVLMNLCVNARDAMPNGGTLEIKAESIVLDEQYTRMHTSAKPGPYIVITVTDQGVGIPPTVMEHIFEPFFTTKEIGKGTGLGLSIVFSIIKSHGGFINVYSEVGKGTTFKIYLPAQVSAQPTVTEEEEILPTGNGEIILVVEDEASIREVTKATLEAYGYSVLTASDGTEAVGIYAKHEKKIALVLTDMMMPYMDGTATIRAIRKMNPLAKFIAVSGLEQNSIAQKQEGVVFLQKPYTSKKLLTTIHEMLVKK